MGPVPLVSAQNSQLSQAVDIWGWSIETCVLQFFPLGIYVFVTTLIIARGGPVVIFDHTMWAH